MGFGWNQQAKLHLSGKIGQDAETRFTATGTPVTTFSVAVTQDHKNPKESTFWYKVQIWGDLGAKRKAEFLKGYFVHVDGTQQLSTYVDKTGGTRISAVVNAQAYDIQVGGILPQRQQLTPDYSDDLPD